MLAAHPYEEVAFEVLEPAAAADRDRDRSGRRARGTDHAERARPARGRRVAAHRDGASASPGDPEAWVQTVAVVGGAGDSLFDAVRASGADVYVTADLRHHPASELRERAALEAGSHDPATGTPYLIEVSHAASEWPWLAGAARRLEAETRVRWPGATVETKVSTLSTDPWTFRLDPSGDHS